MSSSEDQVLSITNLPCGVIRAVIRVGQEDIDIMRQISPQWNTLARTHFNNRKHLPVINYLCWATNDDGQTTLTISVLERFLKYFHLNNWQLKSRISHEDSEPEVEVDSGGIFTSSLPSMRTINRIFGRCSRIENLNINMNILSRSYEMDVIKTAIIAVSNGKLDFKREFNLTNAEQVLIVCNENLHTIMDLIGVTKVERIAMIKRTLSTTDHDVIISVVSRFLRHVSVIELTSRDVDDVDDPQHQPQDPLPHMPQIHELQQWQQLLQQGNQLHNPLQAALARQIQQVQNRPNNLRHLSDFIQLLDKYVFDEQKRIEWRNFSEVLNRNERIRANFYEEYLPNDRAKFCIDISVKET